MKKKIRRESESPLESIRLDHTDLTQDEFIVKCGYSRTTYQRWTRGETEPKFTADQVVNTCRLCNISPRTFLKKLGANTTGIPDDLPPR